MTDNNFAELLVLFYEIEVLMVKNGAKLNKPDGTPTSFSDKVKGFDDYQSGPPNPGDIGFKFYLDKDTGRYEIKDYLEDEDGILDELVKYRAFKRYKENNKTYQTTLMHGNYNTLIKIGHERNQLLHIYDYAIDDHKRFVKVCNSMIRYLKNPDDKPFLGYETLNLPTSTRPSSRRNMSMIRSISSSSKRKISNDILSIVFRVLGIILLVGIGKILILAYAIDSYLLWGALGYGVYAIFTENFLPILGAGILGWVLIFTGHSSHKNPMDTKKKTKTQTVRSVEYKQETKIIRNQVKKHEVSIKKEKPHNSIEVTKTCHYYYIGVNKLYIRGESSSLGLKIGSVRKNSKVCITKTKNGWSYIDGKGWVFSKYLSKKKFVMKKSKKAMKKVTHVWRCEAKSERASGWVEKVGKKNAMSGAIRQCEKRRVTMQRCVVDDCYIIN
jgi:hypothetical protein